MMYRPIRWYTQVRFSVGSAKSGSAWPTVLLAMGWRMMGKQNGVGETWDRNVAVIRSISGS